jgi:aminoglycoside phosphotransferase (APT) family kinase protein
MTETNKTTERSDRTIDATKLMALLSPKHPGVQIDHVEILNDSSGSANRLQLELTYAPGADAGLPARMFLKRNLPKFSFPPEMYTTEVRVYRDLLPGTGIETPGVFSIAANADESEFTILMEDIGIRPGARLGFVLDPTSPDDVDGVLATLAKLHSTFWGDDVVGRRVPWAKPPLQDASMQFWAKIGPNLVRNHLKSGHRADIFDPARWNVDAFWLAFARMVEIDSESPHTFLHGDVHAGNIYYVAGGDGGLLDWQLSLRGCWALDVGYLLTSALTGEDRRAHERPLLQGYLDRLRAAGVDAPSADEAWLRYRQNALYGVMMWLITPDGVHTDEAQIEYLTRCLGAADDLETLDALSPH